MALTINPQSTSSTCYITVAQFLTLYDWRLVSELVSDTGYSVSESELSTDPNLAACLMRASAIFEGACAKGGRYFASDINNLMAYNNGNSVGAWQVIGIISGLTINLLKARRGETAEDDPNYKEAMRLLERINDGDLNFGFLEPETIAGTASWTQFSKQNLVSQKLLFGPASYYFVGNMSRYQ